MLNFLISILNKLQPVLRCTKIILYTFVIEHIADGSLKTDGMIQRTFQLEDWETAFDYATGKYGDFKVAFTF